MKKLLWVVLILAAVIYGLVVYSWILEGNRHFDQLQQNRDQRQW